MTHTECKAFCDTNIESFIYQMGLPHWRIEVDYLPLEDMKGKVELKPEYERAYITLDPAAFKDTSDLTDTIFHELAHIVHSPFHNFCNLCGTFVKGSAFDAVSLAYQHACEMTVRNIERMRHCQHNPIPKAALSTPQEPTDASPE